MGRTQRSIDINELPELGKEIGLDEAKALACAVIERTAEDYKKMSFEGRDRLAKRMENNFWWNLLDYDCTFGEMMLRWEQSVGEDKKREKYMKEKERETMDALEKAYQARHELGVRGVYNSRRRILYDPEERRKRYEKSKERKNK